MFYDKLNEAMKHFCKTGGFLTVKDDTGRVNTMTVSWGFVGYIWMKPCFITVVRPQRYTYELLERADSFTISIPFGTMKEELSVCGSKSGRDTDKSKIVTFSGSKVSSPIVAGCDVFFECKKLYADFMNEAFIPENMKKSFYNSDFHKMYFGEIVS